MQIETYVVSRESYERRGEAHSAPRALGDVYATCAVLASTDADVRPRPIAATAFTTLDIYVDGVAVYSSPHVIEHKVVDEYTICGLSILTIVGLRNDDAVVSALRHGDIAVSDIGDCSVCAGYGFLKKHLVSRASLVDVVIVVPLERTRSIPMNLQFSQIVVIFP